MSYIFEWVVEVEVGFFEFGGLAEVKSGFGEVF